MRVAEITTRIVQAAVVPRAKLDKGLSRPEVRCVGFYFLFGETDDGRPLVYIGEAEDCAVRIGQHHKQKEFWKTAIVIGSRTGSLTKAHVRLLEYMSIERAKAAERYELENGNAGIQPVIPEWMQADVGEIFDTAGTLLSALSFPVFEPRPSRVANNAPTVDDDRRFFCRERGIDAEAIYGEDGLTVLKGSIGRLDAVPSFSGNHAQPRRRTRLIEEQILVEDNGVLCLTRDESFSSPSAAANVMMGGTGNGWLLWKDKHGKTLHERFRTTERD
ncbi:MAG: GIY-YIG nuclease family protein [Planctomycetota bacterium]